jgi:uncharacterized protein (TIGR00730 family)
MAELTKLCVYCGSGTGLDPIFVEAARTLGSALASNDIHLVYGGGSIGLMGALARSTLDAGGRVTGIIPRFLQSRERPILDLTEVIVTEDMHERKMLMYEHSDAFVALPGGVGTLEELVEQITWAQLGRHQKPVLIANIGGFWNALLDLMQAMRRERFIRPDMDVSVLVADTVEAIVPTLQAAIAARPQLRAAQGMAAPLSRM